MGTVTTARSGSTRESVVNYFLDLGKGVFVDTNTVIEEANAYAAPKTVTNVLGTLVAEGALRRTSRGYAVRSIRALNTIIGG